MAQKLETQQQIIERYRGELSKVDFCKQLHISRPTLDKYLDGEYISLKWLTELSVDFADDWRGQLANELIVKVHGANYIPIGSRQELIDFRGFLEECDREDLVLIPQYMNVEYFGLWAAEVRKRNEKEFAEAKARMKAVTA